MDPHLGAPSVSSNESYGWHHGEGKLPQALEGSYHGQKVHDPDARVQGRGTQSPVLQSPWDLRPAGMEILVPLLGMSVHEFMCLC